MTDLTNLQQRYRRFVAERSFQPFHNPKNLAIALSVEASELLEIFTWLTPAQSANPTRIQDIRDEMADVLLYLLRLADVLNIDLLQAAHQKFDKVEQKYTLEKSAEFVRSLTE